MLKAIAQQLNSKRLLSTNELMNVERPERSRSELRARHDGRYWRLLAKTALGRPPQIARAMLRPPQPPPLPLSHTRSRPTPCLWEERRVVCRIQSGQEALKQGQGPKPGHSSQGIEALLYLEARPQSTRGGARRASQTPRAATLAPLQRMGLPTESIHSKQT